MPKPSIESNTAIPLTALCEFCGDDILKLAVNSHQPAADVKVGVAMSGLMEHIFTCRLIRAAFTATGRGVTIAVCDPDDYEEDDNGDEPDDDEPDDD